VESQEWKLPLLYLYRQQLTDSGGAGRWRGGLTAAVALTPIGVPEMVLKSTNTAGTEQSNAHGIDGGYPGAGSQVRMLHATEVWKRLGAGNIPREDADFGGRVEHLPSKASATLKKDDVLVFFAPGGGGFGDPLDREPERVARDVTNGFVSRERARENYGVALNADGAADEAATKTIRDQIRGMRKQRATVEWHCEDVCEHPATNSARPSEGGDPKPQRLDPRLRGDERTEKPWRVAENIELKNSGILHCRRCGEPLDGPNGKVAISERPLSAASPWMALRHNGDSPNFVLEEVSCPSCATLLVIREARRSGGQA
jgi:hypothetical protein